MEFNKDQVLEALSYVIEPDLKKDIVSLNLVKSIDFKDDTLFLTLLSNSPAMHSKKRLQEACIHQIQRFLPKLNTEIVVENLPVNKDRSPEQRKSLPGIKEIIVVASGKGGVGKSTIAANLAAGMAKKGYKVGLVDADIYGPSVPIMFDVAFEKPGVKEVEGKSKMLPVESYGVKIMSIGFFSGADQAVVWRGPMASKALKQMINDVYWGELDYLFIDLPPGTGDIHLTMVQSVPISGAIIVSTPQGVALADARKGIAMFKLKNIGIPVLGLIENMAWFTPEELPDNKYYIFGKDGAKQLSEEMKIPLLAQIPLIQSIREAGDVGRPVVLQEGTPQSNAMLAMLNNFEKINIKALNFQTA